MSNRSVIYVYSDAGASEDMVKHTILSLSKFFYNNQIKTLNAESLIKENWYQNASLLVMPGGADLPYVEKLNGLGNDIIKNYVHNGGNFLGICAGAYYASGYVEFDKSGKYEVLGERELKFFPNKSIGPILAEYNYFTRSGARAAEINTNFTGLETLKIYYNGGGFFNNPKNYPDVEIIARYQENELAAIIRTNYGQGTVILSGVHFEVDPFVFDNSDYYLNKIKPQLQESNQHREELLVELLGNLLSDSNYEYCDK